jgi:hypothetical protein
MMLDMPPGVGKSMLIRAGVSSGMQKRWIRYPR